MNRLLLLAFLLVAFTVQPAFGQIEMGTDGNVGIGASDNSDRKLNIWYDNPSSSTSVIYSRFNAAGFYNATAVFGRATTTAGYGYGGIFHGGYSGVRGFATLSGSGYRYGVYGKGTDGSYNYGLYGYAYGGSTAYGIYAYAAGASTNYAGYFNGDVTVTGTFSNPSDRRFKERVEPMDGQGILTKIATLRPVTYRFKQTAGFEDLTLPDGLHFGLIADELEEVFPELVHEQTHTSAVSANGEEGEAAAEVDASTYKSVNYIELIPILLGALQEQQAEIDALKAALEANNINVDTAGSQ